MTDLPKTDQKKNTDIQNAAPSSQDFESVHGSEGGVAGVKAAAQAYLEARGGKEGGE